MSTSPVPMLLSCPECHKRHVDKGVWRSERLHRTHLCEHCGHEWRPCNEYTVGVKSLPNVANEAKQTMNCPACSHPVGEHKDTKGYWGSRCQKGLDVGVRCLCMKTTLEIRLWYSLDKPVSRTPPGSSQKDKDRTSGRTKRPKRS